MVAVRVRDAKWYAGLDGLRAIAVLSVIAEHWCFHWLRSMSPLFRPGRIGVQLFFVISGFLITGILLDARDSATIKRSSKTQVLSAFIFRRTLRIFPLYYAVIVLACLADVTEIIEWLPWNLTYTSNIRDSIYAPVLDYQHFWSLCIEEQFYLIWPFAILCFPPKATKWIIAAAIAAYPLYVCAIYILEAPQYLNATPFGSMHTLAGGGLLAYWFRDEKSRLACAKYSPVISAITCPIYLLLILACHDTGMTTHLAHNTLMAVSLVSLVGWAASINATHSKHLLTNPVLMFLGSISYGVYLLHPFVPPVIRYTLMQFDLNTAHTLGKLQLPCFFAVTIGLAWLSWRLFETPISRLKRHFPYTPPSSQEA